MVPAWVVPTLSFSVALGLTLGASTWFIRLLEGASDQWHLSAGLLSFVSAVGANIPNYGASLAAFVSGQGMLGLGIIIGSNLYNLAIILSLSILVTPGRHGIMLSLHEMRDVRRVGLFATLMGITTLVAFVVFVIPQQFARLDALGVNGMTLILFMGIAWHAFQRNPDLRASRSVPSIGLRSTPSRQIVLILCALLLAMGGVIGMVQAGQMDAAIIHLPAALLSLVVLAVATSLPNTVVAYQLARTARGSTCIEEVLSSNSINIALGSALPLLIWPVTLTGSALVTLDTPLLGGLGLVILWYVSRKRLSRLVGYTLGAGYVLWVLAHVLLR
jgi:cation:H+ antiporter